jgi:hypothetical protein
MNPQINPEEYYSVRQLANMKVFPWMTSHHALTRYLQTEKGREVLKPVVRQTVAHTRYAIKGETLLEVLAKANKGELTF